MKTMKIVSADIITKAGIEAFVGLTVNVNGQEQQVARTCKQALLDLHKSARGSNIPSGLFDNGVASDNPTLYNLFREQIIGLVGKVCVADVEFYEAGTEYEASEVSSAVKAGTAKVGDILLTEKKGSRVEGFMNFPLSETEVTRREILANVDQNLLIDALLGITVSAPVVTEPVVVPVVASVAPATNVEAFGEFTPEDFATAETAPTATKARK